MSTPRISAKFKVKGMPPNFFTIFKKKALLVATEHNDKLADKTLQGLKDVILNQSYDWKKLTDGYAKRKKRKGLDSRILVATKEYVNKGISKQVIKRGDFETIHVGPSKGTHKASGLPYIILAKVHEYGSEKVNIPARPLYRPYLSVVIKDRTALGRSYKAAVKKAHKEALAKAKIQDK